MRTGRSAHRHTPNPARCADVLVRIPAPCNLKLRTGTSAYPHTPNPNPRGARTGTSVLVRIPAPCDLKLRTGTSAYPRTPNPGGARTSSSAFPPRATPIADGDVRVPPHAEPARCADVLVRIPAPCNLKLRTGTSAYPHTPNLRGARTSSSAFRPRATRRTCEVRGRPRPHSGPVQPQMLLNGSSGICRTISVMRSSAVLPWSLNSRRAKRTADKFAPLRKSRGVDSTRAYSRIALGCGSKM